MGNRGGIRNTEYNSTILHVDVQWLIEHSTSHHQSCLIVRISLRNPYVQ